MSTASHTHARTRTHARTQKQKQTKVVVMTMPDSVHLTCMHRDLVKLDLSYHKTHSLLELLICDHSIM